MSLTSSSLLCQASASHVMKLLYHTASSIKSIIPDLDTVPESLTQEWDEFFADGCYRESLASYVKFVGKLR